MTEQEFYERYESEIAILSEHNVCLKDVCINSEERDIRKFIITNKLTKLEIEKKYYSLWDNITTLERCYNFCISNYVKKLKNKIKDYEN